MKETFKTADSKGIIQISLDEKFLTVNNGEMQKSIERNNLGPASYEVVAGTKKTLTYASLIMFGFFGALILSIMFSWWILIGWMVLSVIAGIYIILTIVGLVKTQSAIGYNVIFSGKKDSDEIAFYVSLEEKEHLLQFITEYNSKIIL